MFEYPEKMHKKYNDEFELEVEQESKQISKEFQLMEEIVVVKDSCDVTIYLTDKQFALSLQAALQAAIVAILQIHIGSQKQAIEVSQELFQFSKIKQINKQKIIVSHSKNVYIEDHDQQAAVNIQILVQLLLVIVKKFGISL